MIDICHNAIEKRVKKPRTDRGHLRQIFLNISKSKRNSRKKTKKAIKKQLTALKRAIKAIMELYECIGLKEKHLKDLEIIRKVYEQQQLEMYKENKRSIKDRIMSKLKETSETEISLKILVMNLGSLLRGFFCNFFGF